jgi:hypothetical protein
MIINGDWSVVNDPYGDAKRTLAAVEASRQTR